MSMKILVTGSEGFVGQYVVRLLLEQGHEVTGVDSLEFQVHGPMAEPKKRKDYKLVVDEAGYLHIGKVYDAVIHLAAVVGVGQSMYMPARYVDCNSLQTVQMLEKLTKVKPGRVVVASSMSVYGEGLRGLEMQSMPTPEWYGPYLHSIYALTKYDQEQLSLLWGKANKVPTVALRFFNIYGPGQALSNPYTGVMAIFASRLLNGKAPVIYEDGLQTRDFVHVEDVARAVVMAATTEMESGIYNVGTGVAHTIKSVAVDMAASMGLPIVPTLTGKHREGDIRHCYADITKISKAGWKPQVKWEDGLKAYCDWLKTQPLPEDKFDKAAGELEEAGLVK